MQRRKGTSVGPQQEMAVATQAQLPNAREQEYEERLFLVYVSMPPTKQVALSISAYDAVLLRQIGGMQILTVLARAAQCCDSVRPYGPELAKQDLAAPVKVHL